MADSTPEFGSFNEAHCSQQPLGPSKFELFPKLSTELRLRIWELSLQRCRLLFVNNGARVTGRRLNNYELKLNRSVPIFIEWLDTDPRPIDLDQTKITFFDHPRMMKKAWDYFEDCILGDQHSQPLQRTFSYAMAESRTRLPKVTDIETMKAYLDRELHRWISFANMMSLDLILDKMIADIPLL
ncbi:hypothetical protein B0I35DRAFT_419055 [Stachybotrys elegans]|uniref:2EXR domain-containing protein n=1 Tax=Stachybotrys elegans TaxID=80388 RepID=A0A8K0T8B2_9HYPO|nr:hypothetical protein B0I35DRAFT_419055 [Stachybotrys elegans]